jgi:hypothetical protein
MLSITPMYVLSFLLSLLCLGPSIRYQAKEERREEEKEQRADQ